MGESYYSHTECWDFHWLGEKNEKVCKSLKNLEVEQIYWNRKTEPRTKILNHVTTLRDTFVQMAPPHVSYWSS